MAGDETSLPREMGKQLVCDVTVVDALATSRFNQGSLCNPGTTATEAEARKIEKYRELIDIGYISQPVALEVQGSLGESSEIFIMRKFFIIHNGHFYKCLHQLWPLMAPIISLRKQILYNFCIPESLIDFVV